MDRQKQRGNKVQVKIEIEQSEEETNIICYECNKRIKRNEGFIPVRYGYVTKHYPNCKNPMPSDKMREYNSISNFHQKWWDDL